MSLELMSYESFRKRLEVRDLHACKYLDTVSNRAVDSICTARLDSLKLLRVFDKFMIAMTPPDFLY